MFGFRELDKRALVIAIAACAACGEGATGPDSSASVEGRVEETAPPASSSAMGAPQSASSTGSQAVAVVQVHADGTYSELATANVEADGRFVVEGVPPGRSELAVIAYADGESVGGVLLHEQSRAGSTIVAAPIDAETTLEARTYMRVRAASTGESASSSELSLLVQADGATASAAAASDAELTAVADAYVTADATLTAAYATSGQVLDASARSALFAEAAVEFASNRTSGMSATVANEVFAEAAIDRLIESGVAVEATALATAAATSTYDAELETTSFARAELVAQPIRLNLIARERLAAAFSTSSASSVALEIADVLADARTSLSFGLGLIDLRAVITGAFSAAADAGTDACVTLLASGASSAIQAEVRTRAEAAFQVARLDLRLQSASTASAAASALAGYRGEVLAAVQAMIAASGNTSVDAQALTSLFIAAGGGAHIR